MNDVISNQNSGAIKDPRLIQMLTYQAEQTLARCEVEALVARADTAIVEANYWRQKKENPDFDQHAAYRHLQAVRQNQTAWEQNVGQAKQALTLAQRGDLPEKGVVIGGSGWGATGDGAEYRHALEQMTAFAERNFTRLPGTARDARRDVVPEPEEKTAASGGKR